MGGCEEEEEENDEEEEDEESEVEESGKIGENVVRERKEYELDDFQMIKTIGESRCEEEDLVMDEISPIKFPPVYLCVVMSCGFAGGFPRESLVAGN